MATVLVVDDDSGIRESAAMALSKVGHRVLQASDAIEAQRVLREHRVDVVVSDIYMPGEDGLALLQSMVQGLLDLERLSLRDFDASPLVDLGDVVAARVAFLRASTERELRVSTAGSLLVRGDAALIERIVDNLVGNALKYTRSPVRVAARQLGDEAVLEVEDEGSGIGDADRERIFQRFFRGATAAGTQGLGLGLSFVAEIARWHGGRVSVERGAAGGSLFRVTFPPADAYAQTGAM